jgi:hypothetical protein
MIEPLTYIIVSDVLSFFTSGDGGGARGSQVVATPSRSSYPIFLVKDAMGGKFVVSGWNKSPGHGAGIAPTKIC